MFCLLYTYSSVVLHVFLSQTLPFMYYLIHEKERFIISKTRGAAERFRYDKTRLFECIKGLQIRRIVMLNRMQHYIKNTNERDRLHSVILISTLSGIKPPHMTNFG